MKNTIVIFLCAIAALLPSHLSAQSNLNQTPSRVVGKNGLDLKSTNPNVVEGREFFNPWYIAVDASSTPPALYVSDAFNNRVLGWRNATQFQSGAPADIVIGQLDKVSTGAQGPQTGRSSGLNVPGAIAVDKQGNLYVVDSGNNRILRFPQPFQQTDDIKTADMVIGQPNFSSTTANNGGVSERSVNTALANTGLAFDGAGNLYFSDALNHRILRYPASALASGMNTPAADVVLGQLNFTLNTAPNTADVNARINKGVLLNPSGMAFDPTGRLYVADGFSRVLVFLPANLVNGGSATRIMGIPASIPNIPSPATSEYTLAGPEGVFMIGNQPAVPDTFANRIVIYDPYESWPAETAIPAPAGSSVFISPPGKTFIGQVDTAGSKVNRGLPEPTESTLNGPLSAVFFGNELYVADSGNNRVLVFPRSGITGSGEARASRVLGQDGFNFNAPNLIEGKELYLYNGMQATSNVGGAFSDGSGIAIDTTSNPPRLYISDTFNNRVLGYADARKVKPGDKADIVIGQPDFRRSAINQPSGDQNMQNNTGLFHPSGLLVDPAGALYVVDSGNGRVLRFPSPFNVPAGARQTANLVLGQVNFTTRNTDATARTMAFPYGIAMTSAGHLLVSDSILQRVVFFRKPATGDFISGQAAEKVVGQFDLVTGFRATAANRFNSPRGIAVDSDDRLYVADAGNGRILIYDNISTAGNDPTAAFGLGGLNGPQGLYVSPLTGEIWVADTRNNRAVRFPRFDRLAISSAPEYSITSNVPLALTQDAFGNLFVAEGVDRVAIFFNGLAATNAASGNDGRPLSPGMITSLFPNSQTVQFASQTVSAPAPTTAAPLPTTLADTQVIINNQPVPLYFVSPGQINFIVPMGIATSGSTEVQVYRPSTGQIVGSFTFPLSPVSPGMFTSNGAGTGQVSALNEDNSVNTPTNQIARGHVLQLFVTGLGFVSNAPPDGSPATGALNADTRPDVLVNTTFLDPKDILYWGLAPGFPGLYQINVRIPDAVPPSPQIPVVIRSQSILSNVGAGGGRLSTTIAVKQ